jgi:hypothetical protein
MSGFLNKFRSGIVNAGTQVAAIGTQGANFVRGVGTTAGRTATNYSCKKAKKIAESERCKTPHPEEEEEDDEPVLDPSPRYSGETLEQLTYSQPEFVKGGRKYRAKTRRNKRKGKKSKKSKKTKKTRRSRRKY